MEYVVLWASHPSWLTLQLPRDVGELIGYRPEGGTHHDASRTVSFLSRGPGIARVVASYSAREALAVETVRGRLLASARPGDRHIFTLPFALLAHLGVRVSPRGPRAGRGTDDGIVWFAPAPEYYEYRSIRGSGRAYNQPSSGPLAHVYLAHSMYPLPKAVEQLEELDSRIETEEWRPAVRMLQKMARPRRVIQ
jgi:hypothetical protein